MSVTPARIILRLLGPIQIERDNEIIRKIGSQKSLALLGYLVQQGQPLSRTTLAGLLWPDQPEAEARRNLRWALNNLSNLLPDCFVADRHTIHFLLAEHAWIDTRTFATLLTQDDDKAFTVANELYRGEFLAGLAIEDCPELELWLLQEREVWRRQAIGVLERLIAWQLDASDYQGVEASLNRLLELEPWREEAHRQLLWLLAVTSRRSAALAHYELCRRILAEELGADPMPETVALYEQIRDDKLDKVTRWQDDKTRDQATAHPVILSSPLLLLGARGHGPQQQNPVTDWGEAPATGTFYGREGEITQLTQWLTTEQAHLVGIFGMGGIGKTTLAATVVRAVAKLGSDSFVYVIWRSLLNAPPLADILHTWVDLLTDHRLTEWPERLDSQLHLLFAQLQNKRCLLVLDNFESILQDGTRAGEYRSGYEAYGQLLEQMGTTSHQSCLLLTSREKPLAFTQLVGTQTPVHVLPLEGLDLNAGRTLLGERGLTGTVAGEVALVMRTSGSPLALKLVAETIRDLFAGDIAQFLADESLIFDDIRAVLEEQFIRLAPLEQDLLLWLAIEREEMTPQRLQENLLPSAPKREFLEALRALQRRSLLEKGATGFTLQNVVIEFATTYLVDTIVHEIRDITPVRLKSHTLLKASAKEYLRQSQVRLLLLPILKGVTAQIGEKGLRQKVQYLLDNLRNVGKEAHYAGGNLLNLLVQAETPLQGVNFSALPIRQAYLRQADLTGVNFYGADFAQVAFDDTFGLVHAVAFNPNGQTLAAAADHEIRIWREVDGQLDMILRGHTDDVWAVAFSPDGEWLVSGAWDRTVRLWEVRSGRLVHTLHGHVKGVVSLAFSADGRTIASGGYDHTIRLWDAMTGACLHCLEQHSEWVWGVAFSPDGGLLASASGDSTIRLWKVKTGEVLAVLEGHTDQVWSVAFSPDGRWLASGGNDQTVRVWDLRTRQTVQVLRGHTGWVRSVAIAPNGELLMSGSNDGTVRIWPLASAARSTIPGEDAQANANGQALHVLRGHRNAVNTVQCDPAGKVIASGSNDQTVRIWDLFTGRPLYVFHGYTNWVRAIAFTPDERHLVSGSDDGKARLWDITTGAIAKSFSGHTQMVRAVSISPDGRILATASADSTVRLWQIGSGKLLQIIRGHTNWVSAVAFSEDGRLLATGSWDETVRIWAVASGELLQTLHGHRRAVYTVTFLPSQADGRYLVASGSSDQTIRLWDAVTGVTVATLSGHRDVVRALACHSDGRLLVSGDEAGDVYLWSVDDDASGATLRAVCSGHTKGVRTVAVTADGRFAISGSDDQTVRLWNTTIVSRHDSVSERAAAVTGELIQTLHGHNNVIWGVASSPAAQIIASGSGDETIRLWTIGANPTTAICTRILTMPGPYADMDITNATGLTEAQKETLKALGAVEATGGSVLPALDASAAQTLTPLVQPHNLPHRSLPLIGRQSELTQLATLITDGAHPLITLLGPGGVGKTRLALAAANSILDFVSHKTPRIADWPADAPSENPKFADGLWFVSLVGLDAGDGEPGDRIAAETLEGKLAAAIATVMGMPLTKDFHEGGTLKDQLIAYLRAKRLLLILDNFEHLLEGAWLVSDLLTQAPGIQIVVTSRVPLQLQEEWRFPVQHMPLPSVAESQAEVDLETLLTYASVALFVQCGQRIHYDFHLDQDNWRAVLQICREVEGLPLAIELAATWLEAMNCQEIAEKLHSGQYGGLDFLETPLRNVPQRHQKIRNVFAATWRLLTDQEQLGAAQLSVFRSGCERADALAITTLRLPELNALIAKSIMQRTESGRIQMHELLRQYATEQLIDLISIQHEKATAIHERHSRYYLDLLCTLAAQVKGQGAGNPVGAALAQLRRELDNLRQAWRWAVEQQEGELLARSLSSYVRLYTLISLFDEGATLMGYTADRLRSAPETNNVATHRYLIGRLFVEQATFLNAQARYAEAVTAIQEALPWLEIEESPWQAAGAYLRWGEALWYQGDTVGARPLLQQAWSLAQQAPQSAAVEIEEIRADILCTQGGIAVRQGDYTVAMTHYEASLQLSQQLDDGPRMSRALHSLGTLWRNQARYEVARQYLEQGLQLAQRMSDLHGECRALNSLGDVALYVGDYVAARRYYTDVLTIGKRSSDRRNVCVALTNLGIVARELGQFTAAQATLTEAMAHAQAIRFPRAEGWCWCCFSLLHSQRHKYQQGLEAAQRALTIFNQLDDRLGQAFSQTNLGRAFAGKGNWSEALFAYNEALRLRRELKQVHLATEVLGGLAAVALAQQDLTVALGHVNVILAYLEHNTPHGLEMPGQLYRICYEVLAANHDSRAAILLATAREFLSARANSLKDETLRQTFLANISAHAFLLQT